MTSLLAIAIFLASVTWSRIPADVTEMDIDQEWIGKCIKGE